MLHRHQRCDAGTFLVYVDSYQNGVPEGQYHHPCGGESGSFRSLTQLLLKIEQGMDVEGLPQSFQVVRTFFSMDVMAEDDCGTILPRTGRVATFSLHIMFRRNASWQGKLCWLEGGQSQSFRSVLELIALLDSAIAARKMMPCFLQEGKLLLEAAE